MLYSSDSRHGGGTCIFNQFRCFRNPKQKLSVNSCHSPCSGLHLLDQVAAGPVRARGRRRRIPLPTTHMLMLKSFFSRRIASASFCWSASSEPTSCGQRRERGQPQPPAPAAHLHIAAGQPIAARGGARKGKARRGGGYGTGGRPQRGRARGKGRRRDGGAGLRSGATAGPTRRTAELSVGSLSKGRSTAIPAGDGATRPPARRNSNGGRAPP